MGVSCGTKGKMTPLTAKLECPHEKGHSFHERERSQEVSSLEVGVGGASDLAGGSAKDGVVLSASEALEASVG
jgi:hypothetical protein